MILYFVAYEPPLAFRPALCRRIAAGCLLETFPDAVCALDRIIAIKRCPHIAHRTDFRVANSTN